MMKHLAIIAALAISSGSISAAPPEGKGGGKGNSGGGDDPATEPFVPAIAYFQKTRTGKDLRLTDRAGEQACLVLQSGDGSAALRGFTYDATNQRLAYSLGADGIFLASWTDDPCSITAVTRLRSLPSGAHPEFLDFSPDGSSMVWTEPDPNDSNSQKIWIHQIDGTSSPLPLQGWQVGGIRFSPNFGASRELVFRGGPNDSSQGAYYSIFAYNVDTGTTRKIFDGAGRSLDVFVTVTNPEGLGEAKVGFTDNDSRELIQVPIAGGSPAVIFEGYEPAFSCDNSEIIHRIASGKGSKYETYITTADGSAAELWTKSDLRWFDWFCP